MIDYLKSSQNDKPDNNYLIHVLSHKILIGKYLSPIITDLINRSSIHDDSKLHGMEKDLFMESGTVKRYGNYLDDEYVTNIKEGGVAVAVAKHYGGNDHHPEHHTDGIEDMDLVQLMEMLVDWKVGGLAYDNGNIFDSIDKNIDRFGIDDQLSAILKNTAKKYLEDDFEWKKEN